jgi:hypothetical protein
MLDPPDSRARKQTEFLDIRAARAPSDGHQGPRKYRPHPGLAASMSVPVVTRARFADAESSRRRRGRGCQLPTWWVTR